MKIAIIDAEIVGKNNHRFPNLACMKISSFYKSQGNEVCLVWDWKDLYFDTQIWVDYEKAFAKYKKLYEKGKSDTKISLLVAETMAKCFDKKNIKYDKIFISKVFTDTEVDEDFLNLDIVEYGGTGFFYDKAPKLAPEIEHSMPDYHLYDEWVNACIESGANEKEFTYYRDYSIGFLTRGCFRQCEFCVNKNYKRCETHSNINEFYDKSRPKLCFLDDNFFANTDWQNIIAEVKEIGVPFQFKQGLDERLLTDKHIHEIISWKYDGDLIFAFDNIADREIIEKKLKRIFELYPNFKKRMKFYVFCGFDRNGKYDKEFWLNDIQDVFERCFILAKYSALPYIMRFEKVYTSEYKGIYSVIASWCNQASFFKKMTFRQFAIGRGMSNELYKIYKGNPEKYIADGHKKGSCWRYMEKFEQEQKAIADKYFDIAGDMLLEYGNGKKIIQCKNT